MKSNLWKSGSKLLAAAAIAALLTFGVSTHAFAADVAKAAKGKKKEVLHTYVIERSIPGAGKLTPAQLHDISAKSNGILKDMGPDIKWVQSYVTPDKVFCVYKAANEDLIREHAKKGGFPVDNIYEVDTMISPKTGK